MKAEVYPSPDGWRFRIIGEPYVRRIDAEQTLRTLLGHSSSVDVTVRDHHTNIVDHYTLGVTANNLIEGVPYEESDELPFSGGEDDADSTV